MIELPMPWLFAYAAVVGFLASALRGFTGFGVAMYATPAMLLVLKAEAVVPLMLLLQILAAAKPAWSLRKDVDWPVLKHILPLAVVGLFPGMALLIWLPPLWAKFWISLLITLAAVQIAAGWRLSEMPRPPVLRGMGLLSGLLQGFASIGGPPVIVAYMASKHPAHVIRATLTALMVFNGTTGAIVAAINGLMTETVLILGAVIAIPVWAGGYLGALAFRSGLSKHYRTVGIAVLLLLGISGMIRSGMALFLPLA